MKVMDKEENSSNPGIKRYFTRFLLELVSQKSSEFKGSSLHHCMCKSPYTTSIVINGPVLTLKLFLGSPTTP